MNEEVAYKEGMDSRAGMRVYTDGSDIDGGVGAAAILFRDGRRRRTLRAYLGESTRHTVYEAELVGILLAAHLLREEGCSQEVEIGIDNQAAMEALNLNKPAPSHYLVDEAQKLLKKLKRKHTTAKLLIQWIPGHMGIEGKELVDTEAKRAAAGDTSPLHTLPAMLRKPLPISASAARRTLDETNIHAAAAHLAGLKRYPRLRSIDASVPSSQFRKLTANLTRKQASLLVQLRTGHAPLNQHLARMGVAESPTCPAYATQRRLLYAELTRDAYSISRLLAHPKAMGPLFRFIIATRRLATTFDGLNTDKQRNRQPTP